MKPVLGFTIVTAAVLCGCGDRSLFAPPATPRAAAITVVSAGPRDDAGAVSLGRQIFFDKRLSVNENISCAYCHDPAAGWTGSESELNAAGGMHDGSIPGRMGNRNPPSSAYATYSPVLHRTQSRDTVVFVGGVFWDGRATGEVFGSPAADQAVRPFLSPIEMALGSPSEVVGRICLGPYGTEFRAVWGDALCGADQTAAAWAAVARSLAAFEASPESNAFSSRYDAFVAGEAVLSPDELRGLALFRGKARCTACHSIATGPFQRSLFTNFRFENIGVPRNPANPWYRADPALNPEGPAWLDRGLGGFLATRPDYQAYAADHFGRQRVPTLRNVDRRPSATFIKAYTHNGYFRTLEGVVRFHNTRDVLPTCSADMPEEDALSAQCWPAPEVNVNVKIGRAHV